MQSFPSPNQKKKKERKKERKRKKESSACGFEHIFSPFFG